MGTLLFFAYLLFTLIVLYNSLNPLVFEVGSIIYLIAATFYVGLSWFFGILIWCSIIFILLLIQVEHLRNWFADFFYKRAKTSIPKLSKTEEEALNAGDPWFEKDIFQGKPNFLLTSTELTLEEQAFLDNETQTLCGLLDEWDINQTHDLSPKVWAYIKENGFFGLIIPKEYGGKGFSARAHSDVVIKIASRSGSAAVTVMVPNSLGPGELIHYYGTKEQKEYYLPRLARGIEVPCFALTEPGAGSDATSLQSTAVVVMKEVDGQTVLGLNLTLDKRWITLAPIASLIGAAVYLKDPQHLLNGEGQEGITCLLIPRDTPNLEVGNRHLPGNQGFMNGTVRGKDIFIPIDTIIGGPKMAGSGWRMLVECLSIGRSISLPALATASSSVSYLATGAFARIRRQFNREIAEFEGVGEKLAQIAGLNYLITSTRALTLAAVNEHKKPSVASAITKYFTSELARVTVNAAMDVHAGFAVVVGPRNYMASFYQGVPISITVEGANIMSRNLLIFGQGSMVCHPFIRDEFYAIQAEDRAMFRGLIWKHINYFMHNLAKAIVSAWTRALFLRAPKSSMKSYYKRLLSLSHAYAWLADFSLIYLGGALKRKECLSARLADALSYLYMAQAALCRADTYKDAADEQVHAQWAVTYCFYHAENAMLELCRNFPSKMLGGLLRLICFPFGRRMPYPSDRLSQALASLMTTNNSYRNRMKHFLYLSGDLKQALDRMEETLQRIIEQEGLSQKISELKRFKGLTLNEKLKEKVALGAISQKEMEDILELEQLRWDALLVDEFSFDSMKRKTFNSVTDKIKSPFW